MTSNLFCHCVFFSPPVTLNLKSDIVDIWQACLDVDQSIFRQFGSMISTEERQRASRFHFERDRRRFVVSRGILRILLGRYLHTAPDRIQFRYGTEGKPALASDEADVRFNLSHSDSMALFGFTRGREIGIDLEKIRPEVPSQGLAELVFSISELRAWRSLPAHQQPEAFFTNWTRKEAYVKAMGKGMSFPIKNLTILPGGSRALIEGTAYRDEAPRWSVNQLDLGSEYAAALAVEGNDWSLRCWSLELS